MVQSKPSQAVKTKTIRVTLSQNLTNMKKKKKKLTSMKQKQRQGDQHV